MFLDASALCAVLLKEDDASTYVDKMDAAAAVLVSPMTIFESVLALARELDGDVAEARKRVARFVNLPKVRFVEIGPAEQELALDAFERYGKGRHPARLNMGDCFAYACARTHGAPLLFKGDDFARTDVSPA
jgi:ribonuclease VapC